jgi:hypothetical protein
LSVYPLRKESLLMDKSSISHSDNNKSLFDSIRHIDDQENEFWYARELMEMLGYKQWQKFNNVIEIAKENLETVTDDVNSHIISMDKMVNRIQGGGRKQLDYKLSRLACYHIALSCDSRGNDSVKMAKHYFAVKTRESEITTESLLSQKPTPKELPQHSAVEYAQAAHMVETLPDNLLKQLVRDALIDELSLQQNLKYLPVAEKPKQYTIVKVRAKRLGYTDKQIGDGKQLGRFVKSQVAPSFQEVIGRYPVYHYEINESLDNAIHKFFN